ncbi:MAG: pyridoxal-dependent decarboxylase [Phycisphaerales bacterium]
MTSFRPPHMSSADFRRAGHALVDWIARYLDEVESRPVLSNVAPGEIRAKLPSAPPEHGEPFERWLDDVERILLPGITHWQSPNFFAYFPANASEPSILGELLSAGLGVQGMLWATSPACTELETHVLDWLVEMLGLPARFRSSGSGGGVIQDTASSSALCALLAARERATRFRSNGEGLAACDERLVAYASEHAHSSIVKAVKIAGLGERSLRLLPVDANHAVRADEFARMIAADRASGRTPFFACATVGTTASNAIDPVAAMAATCREHGAWLHVDAAMSGTAALCPEFRFVNDGLEQADSFCFNPHKWMLVNFDCDAFYVADRAALVNALSVLPEYLRNRATDSGAVIDYRDWHVPLGRRFRALKLWFVIRHYGVEGLRSLVRHHVELARRFESWVRDDPDFELVAPCPLNLVCFRLRASDDANQRLLDRVNASGKAYLTHAKLDGRMVLRMSVGQTRVEERHVRAAWELIRACR